MQSKQGLLIRNQIPKNWQKDNLENLLDILIDHRGITPKKLGGEWSVNGIPALSAKNIKTGKIVNEEDIRFVSQKLYERWMPEKLESGDILLTSEAPLGELYFLKENKDYVLSQRLFALRTNRKKLNSRYLYYYLQGSIGRHELLRRLSGTAAEGIRQAELRKINVEFPEDILEQEKIVSMVSAFDDKIEVNNKIAKTLEEMAQALFREWFVKFKFPSYQKIEFEDSTLGKIPKGWRIQNIDDVCETSGGGTPSTSNEEYWQEGTISWATPTDMTALKGPFIFGTEKKITDKGLKNSSTKILPTDSILMTSRATVGIIAISKIPICTNQGFISLVCEYPSNYFMYCFLKSRLGEIKGLATGSTFPEISKGVFRKIRIVVPDREVALMFNFLVDPMFEKISKVMLENQKLAALRDLFLPKLMRGEIRV